jgi:hypothetical protein
MLLVAHCDGAANQLYACGRGAGSNNIVVNRTGPPASGQASCRAGTIGGSLKTNASMPTEPRTPPAPTDQPADASTPTPTPHARAAQSAGKARRLRTEADKLEAFCVVVRAASSAADHAAFTEVSRAASKALQAKFGGGTITSVFAWLTSSAGKDALDSVLAGEVELSGSLSVEQIVEAVALAQKAELLRATQG